MLIALIVTTLAGAATVVGGLLGVHGKVVGRQERLAAALAFAAGAMVLVSLVEILPKGAAELAGSRTPAGAWALTLLLAALGAAVVLLLRLVVDRHLGVPSDAHLDHPQAVTALQLRARLWRGGVLVAVAVGLHNVPEGMATFAATLADPRVGVVLAVAIAIHNIPEGMAVAVPVHAATGSKAKAVGMSALSGVAEPIGGLLGVLLLQVLLPGAAFGVIFGVVGGMMLLISLQQLLPMARQLGGRHHVVLGTLLGAGVMATSLGLLQLT